MTTGECRHTDLRPLWGCRTGAWGRCRCGVNVHRPTGLVYNPWTWALITEPRVVSP